MTRKRWQDWAMLALGIWLLLSPFILQYGDFAGKAALNSYVLGIGLVVFATAALLRPRMWEEWANLALGVWLILSPFALSFEAEAIARWNHIVLGILICADAIWVVVQRRIGGDTS